MKMEAEKVVPIGRGVTVTFREAARAEILRDVAQHPFCVMP